MDDVTIHDAFAAIYREQTWTHGSGPGSSPANTIEYRAFLQRFMDANRIRTVTDLGCGDWQFSHLMDWSSVHYIGFDVVESIVAANREHHARENVAFKLFRSIDDFPGGDLLLCKEVLQHLPNETILRYVDAIRNKYRFALLTNSTEPEAAANGDIAVGGFRPLRLDEAPFKVPGAKVLTYYPQAGTHVFKNIVYLVAGLTTVVPGRAAEQQPAFVAPPFKQTVCLCMILKDESAVIERCLASVRSLVHSWLIIDTGSNDDTINIVRAAMAGVPGEIVERPWVDFGHNRTEALELARPRAAYSLMIDADDELLVPPDIRTLDLNKDAYVVAVTDGSLAYDRTQLFSNALPWRYVGKLYDVARCEEAQSIGRLPFVMRRNLDGRRRGSTTAAADAAILEQALATETDPFLRSRYTFYLGQSYRDCGQLPLAIAAYLGRSEMGFEQDEIYLSLYQAARLMEASGHDLDETIAMYERATAAGPTRAEAAHAASKLCRGAGRNTQGCVVAQPALGLPVPSGGLCVEPWIYEYGLRDEFSVNAYWAQRYDESLEHSLLALDHDAIPPADRKRIIANARFASQKLTESMQSWPEDAPMRPPLRGLLTQDASPPPRVLVAILAKQKAPVLPLFLRCLEMLDYPKERIVLYVRTNNNTDDTGDILRRWIAANRHRYAGIDYDDSDVAASIETLGVHEWTAARFRILVPLHRGYDSLTGLG